MKQKLSITVDEENVRQIERVLQEGTFRNKSHVVEFAVVKLMNEIMNEKTSKKSNQKENEKWKNKNWIQMKKSILLMNS